jgi:hypothetical protein
MFTVQHVSDEVQIYGHTLIYATFVLSKLTKKKKIAEAETIQKQENTIQKVSLFP